MMASADRQYVNLIHEVSRYGDRVMTRNSPTFSHIGTEPLLFTNTPLVTVRKTAWKMALREMEWFMSGDPKCPEALLPWWKGQLDADGLYRGGYGEQFRYSTCSDEHGDPIPFDQIAFLIENLRDHPNSRRLILTTWNPGEMAHITEINGNPNTPTTCHATMVQFFVRNGALHAKHYQRSADLLLGVPHNWIQHWALMLYLAHHAGLTVGSLRWDFGDAHIYDEPSHREAVEAINDTMAHPACHAELRYEPPSDLPMRDGIPQFRAEDFRMEGDIPPPSVTVKPKLIE